MGAVHYQTSAKVNKGIEELFLDLSKRMLEQSQKSASPGGITVGATPAGRIFSDSVYLLVNKSKTMS